MSVLVALHPRPESYYVLLTRALGIPQQHVNRLEALFRRFLLEGEAIPNNEKEELQAIRDFLRLWKNQYKPVLADSILGKSGCFPYSVRLCIIAGRMGIDSRLARLAGLRSLHILLVDRDGVPFNRSELRKAGIVPLTPLQARSYARFVQTTMDTIYSVRRFFRRFR